MRGREWIVIAALAPGLLALGLAGQAMVAAAAAIGATLAPWARPALARVPWGAVIVLLVIGAAAWAVQVDAAAAAGPLLAALAVQRRLARTSPADDRATLALSVLMLAFAATRTDQPLFLVLVLALAGLAPAALLAEEGSRRRPVPRGLVAGLSLACVALVPALFVLMPRVGPARSPPAQAHTGFVSEFALGDMDTMLDDQAPVARLRFRGEQPEPPIYLRGTALDRFDGRRWSTGTERSVRAIERRRESAEAIVPGTTEVVVVREPLAEGVLFTTGQVLRIAGDVPWVRQDPQGGLWFPGEPARERYLLHAIPPFDGTSVSPGPAVDDEARARLTEVPPILGLHELAERWAGGIVDPEAKVEAIREHLLREYAYTRAPLDSTAEDPLPVFLFERRSGHCEYFASALAVLLRDQGVPTRVVTGFAGGEYAGGWWQLRRSDAHAWVEVWLPERGWVGVDATPGPPVDLAPGPLSTAGLALDRLWYDGLLGYDLAVQASAVVSAGRVVESAFPAADDAGPPWLGLVLVGVGGGVLAAGAWALLARIARRLAGERAPERPRGRVARAHQRARRVIARRGWVIPESLPPVAAAAWLRERAGDAAGPLERLAWLHYRVRYGREDDAVHGAEAERLSAEIARIRPPGAFDDAGAVVGPAAGRV